MAHNTCFSIRTSGSVTVVDVCSTKGNRWPVWRMYVPTKSSLARLRMIYSREPRRFYIYKGEFSVARKAALLELSRRLTQTAMTALQGSLDLLPTSVRHAKI